MKHVFVRELMTPIEKFHRISVNASLFEALQALQSAQDDLLTGKTKQRVVVVENDKGEVIGKISPSNLIRGLEPGYDRILTLGKDSRAHAVDYVINTMQVQTMLWSTPLKDICATVKDIKVGDFYNRPTEGQTVQIDDTLDTALHRFVLGRYRSLFVLDQHKIVGMLLFAKVFRAIGEEIKQCTF